MVTKVSFPSLDVETDAPALLRRSQLVSDLQTTQPKGELAVPVPMWLAKAVLLQYLSLLSVPALPALSFPEALQLLKTACYLQDQEMEEKLIASSALNAFTPDTVLAVYAVAADHWGRSKAWEKFYEKIINFARGHVIFLIEKCNAALMELRESALEKLLFASLKTDFGRPVADHAPVIRTLKTLWGSTSVPDMLERVERRAKETALPAPVLEWPTDLKPSTQFYESPEFEVEGLTWVLQLWYYAKEDRLDCFLGNGVGERQHIPGALVALSLNLTFFDDDCLVDSKVMTLLLGSKGHKLTRSVYGLKNRLPGGRLKVRVQMRLEHAYSALFTYLATHFDDPQVSDKAAKLSGERIMQLIVMKQLSVSSEDTVLRLLGQWCERHRRETDVMVQMEDLLDAVRWEYISTRTMLECIRVFPSMKSSPVFRDAVYREFASRSHLRVRRGDLQPPRASYQSQHPTDTVTNFSVFLSDICSLIVSMDYTPQPKPSTEVAELRRVLRDRELQAQYLRDSLTAVHRIVKSAGNSLAPFSASGAPSPVMFKGEQDDDSLDERVYKNHSETRDSLSATAPKSSKRTMSSQSVEAPSTDKRVAEMLSSFLQKVEDRAKVADSDRS